jgi:urease accessory protein
VLLILTFLILNFSVQMLPLFRPLPVVREVSRETSLPGGARDYRRDTTTLGWEDRLRGRARRRSDAGLEFGTALPRGTVLRAGDCLVVVEARAIVVVVEREEPVFIVSPSSPHEWGLFAYHIGNSHQPMMLSAEGIVCPDVPGMEQLLQLHGVTFSRAMRAFTPVGFVPDHRHRLPGQV